MKHNKRRNTAFLFESLVRELTKSSIKENTEKSAEITGLLKEFFKKGTVLAQELDLYKSLYQTTNISKQEAERVLSEVKRVYSTLDKGSVFQAQSKLVSKINKTVGNSAFTNFVPNYKNIASIAQIFNDKVSIKTKVLLETQILNHMVSLRVEQKEKEMKLNNAELKMFAKNFNSAYGELLEEQKELLSKFISSFQDNGLELKVFLNEELGRLREEIKSSLNEAEIKADETLSAKTKKIVDVIDGFKGQFINEKMLKKIMSIQSYNPQLAARLISPFLYWDRYDEERQQLMIEQPPKKV